MTDCAAGGSPEGRRGEAVCWGAAVGGSSDGGKMRTYGNRWDFPVWVPGLGCEQLSVSQGLWAMGGGGLLGLFTPSLGHRGPLGLTPAPRRVCSPMAASTGPVAQRDPSCLSACRAVLHVADLPLCVAHSLVEGRWGVPSFLLF